MNKKIKLENALALLVSKRLKVCFMIKSVHVTKKGLA